MRIKDLSFKHQKHGPYFFHSLSFYLEPGKIHALHGKNGTGKSVLLGILAKKTAPHAIIKGEICGFDHVVLVNQRFDSMIADHFSFNDNLRFATINFLPSPFTFLKKENNSFAVLLEKFHINFQAPVHKLSGGQRQILALLMVLQKKPQILLLDEPTATLDEDNAAMVFDFLTTLAEKGYTFLVVCHDRELIAKYATGKQLHLEADHEGLRKLIIS